MKRVKLQNCAMISVAEHMAQLVNVQNIINFISDIIYELILET